MAVYLVGLLQVTAAIELTLALLLASQGKVPAPSSDFWPVYLFVDIALVAAGGILIARGLETMHSPTPEASPDPAEDNPPPD